MTLIPKTKKVASPNPCRVNATPLRPTGLARGGNDPIKNNMPAPKLIKFDVYFTNPHRVHVILAPDKILQWSYPRRKAWLDKQPQAHGYSEIRKHR